MKSRYTRFVVLLLLYAGAATLTYWLAWRLRFGFYPGLDGIPDQFADKVVWQGVAVVSFKMLCLYALGQFTGLVRFFRLPDAIRLFIGSSLATFVFLVIWVFSSFAIVPPGSIIVVDFILFTFAVMGARVGLRILDERRKGFFRGGRKPDRIAIVGAGQAGSALLTELNSRPELNMRAIVFFDDAKAKHGRQLHGIPIAGMPEEIPSYHATHDLDKVILAMPGADTARIREIVSLLKRKGIPVETVPSVEELMNGTFRASLTRAVNIEDLLYRESVKINSEDLRQFVHGRTVVVTGAGGSIGRELAYQLSSLSPKRLVLLDRCESVLFVTEKRIRDAGIEIDLDIQVVDVSDGSEMGRLLSRLNPDILYHAAAHKHVGMMERQPAEAFRNNVLATLKLAQLAVEHQIAHFCLISTDKAVYPSSVMGASKRLAELALQALIRSQATGNTNFSMVRFGNVIGSSGSVIPIFEEQIDRGGPVTVTHPEMTRYFMTIPEAVGLVLQVTALPEVNALYMLDMGTPVKIDSVARDLIRLKGLEPDIDIEIVYTGIGAGEKMHERLHREEERVDATVHPKVHRLSNQPLSEPQAKVYLKNLEAMAHPIKHLSAKEARTRLFEFLESSENHKV